MAISPMANQDQVAGGNAKQYPSAAEMPEVRTAQAAEDGTGAEGIANPVTDAIRTLVQFVLAMKEKGLPQADALQKNIGDFIQTLTSAGAQGGGAQPETPQPEAQQPEAAGEPPAEPQVEETPEEMSPPENMDQQDQMMQQEQNVKPLKKRRTSTPINTIQPF